MGEMYKEIRWILMLTMLHYDLAFYLEEQMGYNTRCRVLCETQRLPQCVDEITKKSLVMGVL
jgi:hypothetical protein